MPVSIAPEVELMFQDWGTSVAHQRVDQQYQPATQTVEETVTETELTAIVSPRQETLARDTAGQHRVSRRQFLVRAADWPEVDSQTLRRLRHAQDVYDVESCLHSEWSGLLEITGRRRN